MLQLIVRSMTIVLERSEMINKKRIIIEFSGFENCLFIVDYVLFYSLFFKLEDEGEITIRQIEFSEIINEN
jgi:hypothetical protein